MDRSGAGPKYGLHLSRPGNGISHYIHMEPFAKPGPMIGVDSHTTQAGCIRMIAFGAGVGDDIRDRRPLS